MFSALLRRGVTIIIERRNAAFVPVLIGVTFIFLLSFVQCPQLSAQNETGLREMNSNHHRLSWRKYDSSRAYYQTVFPILRALPPLQADMPTSVRAEYSFVDSLLSALAPKREAFDKRELPLSDTLKRRCKALFTLCDYNPIIFEQYAVETEFYQRQESDSSPITQLAKKEVELKVQPAPLSTPYRPRYLSTVDDLMKDYSKIIHCSPMGIYGIVSNEKKALYSLLASDYILRVRIISIDSMLGKSSPVRGIRLYRAVAEVMDTLKGRVFQSYPSQAMAIDSNALYQSSFPLLRFVFTNMDYGSLTLSCPSPIYRKGDEAFMNWHGDFQMYNGQEAIIFLRLQRHLFSLSHDYFDVALCPDCSGNALPIIEGSIRDVNHVWSDSTHLSYSDWKQRVQHLIDKIKTCDY